MFEIKFEVLLNVSAQKDVGWTMDTGALEVVIIQVYSTYSSQSKPVFLLYGYFSVLSGHQGLIKQEEWRGEGG